MLSLSFSEVRQGISVPITSDGLISATELTMAITGKNSNNSNQILRDLKPEVFPSQNFIIKSFFGKGNGRKKLLTLQHAIELVMILPGKTAKSMRREFADIISRYLDGDLSLCIEIDENRQMGRGRSYPKFIKNAIENQRDKSSKGSGKMQKISYVYACKSTAFPGLIKIGKTENVMKRMIQLNTGCAPAPHVVVAVATTFDNNRDEKACHQFFEAYRREGEFFEISEEEIINYFNMHIQAQFNSEMNRYLASLQASTPK